MAAAMKVRARVTAALKTHFEKHQLPLWWSAIVR